MLRLIFYYIVKILLYEFYICFYFNFFKQIDYNNEFDFMFYVDIKMEVDFINCFLGYCKIWKGVIVNKDLDLFIDRNGYFVFKLYKFYMFDIFEKCWIDFSFRKGRRI